MTSGDLIIDLICIVDFASERASKYQHLKCLYDSFSSESINLGSVINFGGVKTYFSILLTLLVFHLLKISQLSTYTNMGGY